MAPLVEDMLHDARTGLTKAVVTGPGIAVLFYGRHLLGEGCPRDSPMKYTPRDASSDCQPLQHQPLRGQDCNRCWRDQRLPPPQLPSPSPDCGFESGRSSLSMALLMLSMSDRSEGSWHNQQGRQHREDGAHMKINLPVFKDEDAKDAVTYQSWRWDSTVYQCVGCRNCTLLPYAIWSLQGHPGEFIWSSGMDITLDDMLTILDKHYNNVKALDALNQELLQLRMADKETVSDCGVHLSRHLQVLAALFPDCFSLDWVVELKRDCFYGRLPKCLKVMVAYLKAGPQVRTYSNYLRTPWEVEKEDSIKLSRSPRTQTTVNDPKPWATSFFPLQKFKGNQPTP